MVALCAQRLEQSLFVVILSPPALRRASASPLAPRSEQHVVQLAAADGAQTSRGRAHRANGKHREQPPVHEPDETQAIMQPPPRTHVERVTGTSDLSAPRLTTGRDPALTQNLFRHRVGVPCSEDALCQRSIVSVRCVCVCPFVDVFSLLCCSCLRVWLALCRLALRCRCRRVARCFSSLAAGHSFPQQQRAGGGEAIGSRVVNLECHVMSERVVSASAEQRRLKLVQGALAPPLCAWWPQPSARRPGPSAG
jgi:hypothetical protein